MEWLFFTQKKGSKNKTSISDAVLTMRSAITKLELRIKELDQKKTEEQEKAKKMVRTDKRRALMALKRSKMFDAHSVKLLDTQMNVESQLLHLQNVELSQYIIGAMRMGNSAMRGIDGMNIDSVDDTMEDVDEMLNIAREIGDALGQPMGDITFDESELEQELADLEGEMVGDLLSNMESQRCEEKPIPNSSTRTEAPINPVNEVDELDKYNF